MEYKPADFRPEVSSEEFVSSVISSSEERFEVGVLLVGAGPANLACAIYLMKLLQSEPEILESLGETPVAIVEKGKYPGAHLLSGAVVNPSALRELFPDLSNEDFPFYGPVTGEALYFLTAQKAFKAPFMPPPMRNHGNFVTSLSRLGQWLAEQAEQLGAMLLNETTATKLLIDDGVVRGIRTDDKGLDREGKPMPNYEPGAEILSKITVIGEGTLGHLTQTLLEHFGIRRRNPQIYALGVKEVWEVARPLHRVIHTMGWPLRLAKKYREFGGSFIYPMGSDRVSLGFVVGLDYADAMLSPHDLLQELKTHPLVNEILRGGKRIEWGAKTIPEGGYYSLPERLSVPGALILGDAAGLVNVPALKGIHYAMWSGIFAAQTIFEILKQKQDFTSQNALQNYDVRILSGTVGSDLYKVRNMRAAFQKGFWSGAFLAGMMSLTAGRFPGGVFPLKADADHPVFQGERQFPKPDNSLTFDKLSSVYASGNKSRDTLPNHLRVRTDVPEVIAETWINMCPAQVYEWKEGESGQRELAINAPNCVHCGAITAKGGRFTPPEGGSGPEYKEV